MIFCFANILILRSKNIADSAATDKIYKFLKYSAM